MIRILFVCFLLVGCAHLENVAKNLTMTKEEKKQARFAKHREKCTELGFNPENVEHTKCVLRLEQSWIEAEAVQNAADSIWIHSSSQPQPTRHCAPDFVTGGCL